MKPRGGQGEATRAAGSDQADSQKKDLHVTGLVVSHMFPSGLQGASEGFRDCFGSRSRAENLLASFNPNTSTLLSLRQ